MLNFPKLVKQHEDISAFILSGGASSRMGRDKGLLTIGGQPLLVRIAHLVEPLVSSVTIVGPVERYGALGLRVVADRKFSGRTGYFVLHGPLAGIATALAGTDTAWNLILACDLPFLTGEWVDWLLTRTIETRPEAVRPRIVMPRTARGPEPLAALYRRECADLMAALLVRGVRKVVEAIEQFQVEFLFERDWRHIDPSGRVLRNMNTFADYNEALAILGGQ